MTLREYVTGDEAVEKLCSGEWGLIACAHEEWEAACSYLYLEPNGKIFRIGILTMEEALSPDFLKLKRWYEYKDES